MMPQAVKYLQIQLRRTEEEMIQTWHRGHQKKLECLWQIDSSDSVKNIA